MRDAVSLARVLGGRRPYVDDFRLWGHVDRSGPVVVGMASPCWLWCGGKSGRPMLGCTSIRGVKMSTSTAALVLAGVEVPPGYCACHICDVPACVNPEHIYAGTAKDNARDRSERHAGGEVAVESRRAVLWAVQEFGRVSVAWPAPPVEAMRRLIRAGLDATRKPS